MRKIRFLLFILIIGCGFTYGQDRAILPLDLQIGFGLPRKPFIDLGVYLGPTQRHRIGIGADYRIPIKLFEDFKISNNSFSPLFFFHMGAYDGPGTFIHYEKLLGNNKITLGAKVEFAQVQSKSYWKGTSQYDHCIKAQMYNATFTVGLPIDRRGIFNIHGDSGISLMYGLSTKRYQTAPWGPISYKSQFFLMGGLYVQISLRVKIVGFNAGVAQNR